MRILLLSEWFDPEVHPRALSFARELVQRGHEVEVLTGFPNYPGGVVYPGYRIRVWQRETLGGVSVLRVPLFPSHDRSGLRRFLTYSSFAISAATIGASLVRRPDVVHVYHPPATIGLPALAIRALHGCPIVYDVQDLWPDTIAATGMMGGGLAMRGLDAWCRLVYRAADRVVVISPGFKRVLVERGVPADSIEVIHNWADEQNVRPLARDDGLARALGLAGRFNVVFAGTMGLAQGLDTVLDAARICAGVSPAVQFVFVGGGVDRDRLERRASDMALGNTLFLPRLPIDEIGRVFAIADVLLVHLKDDPLFRITIPSKTQAYLASGRPILMAAEGDAADLVRQSRGGVTCPPSDPESLADAVLRLSGYSRGTLEEMGESGRSFYLRELGMARGVSKFEAVFRMALDTPSAPVGSLPLASDV